MVIDLNVYLSSNRRRCILHCRLNLYGFRRVTTGPDRGACYHELFLRQKPTLASRIQRIRLKGQGPRKPAIPAEEPNFYRLPWLPTREMVQRQYQLLSQGPSPLRVTCGTPNGPSPVANPLPVDTCDENTVFSKKKQQTRTTLPASSANDCVALPKVISAMTCPPSMPKNLVPSARKTSPIVSEPASPASPPIPLLPRCEPQPIISSHEYDTASPLAINSHRSSVTRTVSQITLDMSDSGKKRDGTTVSSPLPAINLQARKLQSFDFKMEELSQWTHEPTNNQEEENYCDFDFDSVLSDLAMGRFSSV